MEDGYGGQPAVPGFGLLCLWWWCLNAVAHGKICAQRLAHSELQYLPRGLVCVPWPLQASGASALSWESLLVGVGRKST